MRNKDTRFTVGVFVGGIADEVTRSVCKGVFQEARNLDVNVVVFPGKYLERDLSGNPKLMYEYQYNTLFAYAREENVDALVIAAGSIGCFMTQERLEKVLAQYRNIPSVLVSAKADGFVSVCFDNYEGIREGMEQLIRAGGCTKFGMIGGSTENSDARERKESFIKILSDNGIEFHEKMYVEGDLSRRCTEQAGKLLDDNPGIEAVFCVNDETAMALYEEIKRRGMHVGKDIFVLGYDDTAVAAHAFPTLSSVRADPGRLGQEALKLAVCMAKGEKVESQVLPTQFVRRDSSYQEETEEELRQRGARDLDAGFDNIYYRYEHEGDPVQISRLRSGYRKFITELIETFDTQELNALEYGKIFFALDDFLGLGGVEYADTDSLLTVLEKIYRELYHGQNSDKARFQLRNTFAIIYQKLIREMNNQVGIMNNKRDTENCEMKIFVQEMLQFEKGRDQSYGVLLENLDWLQIRNACIYTFSKHMLRLQREKFVVPEELCAKAVLKDGVVRTVPAGRQKQKIANLFSNNVLQNEGRFVRVLLPLFFKENLYGVLLCDMTESLYTNGEFLINQMGSAAKMISLLRANEKIQQQLEENIATLKEHNIELDTISKIDVLTGIWNRRGFYLEAEAFMERARRENRKLLAIYVDMNNLKIINDRYGHEEGDYSLKLIGTFLKEIVDVKGIAGRIGGDEYACVLEDVCEDEILPKIYEKFESFNKTSDRAYNITVSAGAYLLKPEETQTLEEALLLADEKLYEVKKYRKKDVAKKR